MDLHRLGTIAVTVTEHHGGDKGRACGMPGIACGRIELRRIRGTIRAEPSQNAGKYNLWTNNPAFAPTRAQLRSVDWISGRGTRLKRRSTGTPTEARTEELTMSDKLLKLYVQFRTDERGVTLVEYGIAIALAVAVGTGALLTLGTTINGSLGTAGAAMP